MHCVMCRMPTPWITSRRSNSSKTYTRYAFKAALHFSLLAGFQQHLAKFICGVEQHMADFICVLSWQVFNRM